MKFIKLLLGIAIGIFVLIAALSNRQTITIHLFPLQTIVEMPLFLLIFITLIIGIILGGIVNFSYAWRWKRKARSAEALSQSQDEEITILKTSSKILGNR